MHTVTKSYRDFPAAHRQPKHDGHCKLLHGHDWRFDITFGCDELDENGFVLDVGKLRPVKDMLVHYFDHTLLLNLDDPFLAHLRAVLEDGPITEDPHLIPFFADIRVVPSCSMEGLAKFVFEKIEEFIHDNDGVIRNLRVVSVVCWEDSKNRAEYRP